MPRVYKVPLVLDPEPGGGYTVTSPLLPELVTGGATLDEALANVQDALAAVVEIYEDFHAPLPEGLDQDCRKALAFECLVSLP